MATIDFIVIGNELLNGKIADLNTKVLADILYQNHFQLGQVHIIGDNSAQFQRTLEFAKNQSDAVITSGGLGPTADDKTKQMLADFFQKKISLSETALQFVQRIYKRREREYNSTLFDYHLLPQDFTLLDNAQGFAPGLFFEDSHQLFFATPGVPSEFSGMMEKEILPRLKSKFPKTQKQEHFIARTWKIPESKIFNEIAPTLWSDLAAVGEVSSLPHLFGVDIGVILTGSDKEIEIKKKNCLELIQKSDVSDYLWQIGKKSLAELIVEEAAEKKLTLGFAESCTGGLCASMITDVSGSSKVFWGSVVSYANEVKTKSLKVKQHTLKNFGAVSAETAGEMASGAKEHLCVDIAVTTTGIAGPLGGTQDKPVGTVGIGISTNDTTKSKLYYFKGNREVLKQRFAHKALMTMLEAIRSHP